MSARLNPVNIECPRESDVIDALASAKLLAPGLFGLPATPGPPKRHPNL